MIIGLTLNVLQIQLVGTFGVALTIWNKIPAKIVCTVICNNVGLCNNRGDWFLEERITEIIIPHFLTWVLGNVAEN